MKINEIKIDINGRELILRNATEQDGEMLIQYLKETTEETRYLVREAEEIILTLEQE